MILPDDVPAHPYAVAWECVTGPWRDPPVGVQVIGA